MIGDPEFIPRTNNLFSEPLNQGQYTIWEKTHVVPVESVENRHSKIRKLATDKYLKSANRQQVNFDSKMAKKSISYNENDTVGIRIHEVDRTNTDPKLLPCKVQTVEKKTTENGSEIVYKLFTNKGKLKNTFKQADLIDLRNVQFDTLLDVDIESLEDISVIQASRQVTNWAKGASVCTCRGKCNTAKCKCKRAAVPCSTKCHPKSTRSCLNKDNHSGE
jgi:hypothetical protein